MSPASRWSRNWTPLTTRPSLTSRQGMILRAGIERLREPEAALPQGLADDRPRRAGLLDAAQVVECGDAPRGLHGQVGEGGRDAPDQAEIRPREHAVARDVGNEEVARRRVEGGDVPQAAARAFGPAARGDHRLV